MDVEIELLGPMALRCAGTVHHLQSAQARVAFARLVLAGPQGVTRAELADVVWPGDLPPTWASALRTLVSRLRTVAGLLTGDGGDPLVNRGGRYVLTFDEHVLVDVGDAARSVAAAHAALAAGDVPAADASATRAADRLRLPFLSEHEGDWVAEWRTRLTSQLVAALEIAAGAALAAGDHARAAVLAEEATTRAPERESAHRCLMAVREAMGNRGEALRTYQRLRRYLAEELGVDPSPATEAAYLALLGPSASEPGPAAAGGRGGRVVRRPVPFVGRGAELACLADAWTRTVRGRRQFVLVTGEAGIGRTRLLREAGAAVAARGGLLLLGRCDEDAQIPYQPLVEALDAYVAAAADDPLADVSPAALGPLRLLLPSLGGGCPPGELPEQPILFAALTQLLLVAARDRPCAVLIDDVQWADRPTVALLRHLLRTTPNGRLCLVVAARSDLPTAAWRRTRVELDEAMLPLEHAGDGLELALGGLDRAAVEALLKQGGTGTDSRLVDPAVAVDLAGRMHRRSGGNPLLLLEMLRHPAGPEAVPPVVARLVAAIQAGIGQDATRLLQVAAISGPSIDFAAAAAAAGLDVLAALDALETLLRAGVLVEIGTPDSRRPDQPASYRFRHDVVRQAVYEQVSDARRRHVTARQRIVPGSWRAPGVPLSRSGPPRV